MPPSSDPLSLAWLDGDLKLPHMPKFTPRKPNRRDKSSRQISKLFGDAPKLMEKKALPEEATKDEDLPFEEDPALYPHDLKAIMKPALIFGLRVSTLISRDKIMRQRKPETVSEDEAPDSTIVQRKRALDHAKLVTEQLDQRSSKRICLKHPRNIPDDEAETFKFTELPSEIRDMIYTFYFTNSSGEKPILMWAFKIKNVKIKGDFYSAAEKVYYTVNNLSFSIKECVRNSILGNMDDFHVGMIRKMTIDIPYVYPRGLRDPIISL
jgi:hypothetical protein